jgi:hypothetical protein
MALKPWHNQFSLQAIHFNKILSSGCYRFVLSDFKVLECLLSRIARSGLSDGENGMDFTRHDNMVRMGRNMQLQIPIKEINGLVMRSSWNGRHGMSANVVELGDIITLRKEYYTIPSSCENNPRRLVAPRALIPTYPPFVADSIVEPLSKHTTCTRL